MTTLPEEAVKAMPERIFAKVHGASTDLISGQRGLIGGWNEHKRDGQIEYVRSDLIATYQAAALAQAIQIAERPVIGFSDGAVEASRYIASSISALTAALPFLSVQVAVKKLEWVVWCDGWQAHTPFGSYTVEPYDGAWKWRYCFDEYFDEEEFICDGPEDGKSKASVHWIERVTPILEPSANACPCTKIQQDETCPVGYPSLLCETCGGKGVLQPSAAAFAIIDRPIVGIENRTPQEVHDILRDRIKLATRSSPDHADAGKVEGDGTAAARAVLGGKP